MAEVLIASCGLDCAACPAFHASHRLSTEERQKVADQWSKEYNFQFKAADIDCVGCTVKDGVHIGNCAVCGFRTCAFGKGYTTCAECADFPCQKLADFFKSAPQARPTLEKLRAV